MKKIGILTRHCYPNYGSILQAYALQSALTMLKSKPVVLDYVQPDDKPAGLVNSNLRIASIGKTWWGRTIYFAVQFPTFLTMVWTFRSHQKRLLNLSNEVEDAEGLKLVSQELAIVIVGSDQVWNRLTDSIDKNYFLLFLEDRKRRSSYAASIGSTKPVDADINLVINALGQMSAVSVREPSSSDWLNTQGIPARSDVDPVLLHSKAFWSNFAGPRRFKGSYILVYQLHNTKHFTQRLEEIKRKHSLPIIRLTPDWKHIIRPGKSKILVSPESFVAWIRDANCVVTDSFHGTAFSLRLGTPIYIIPPGKYSTRLIDVVLRVGLERLVVSSETTDPLPESPFYNAESVQIELDRQASDSWDYLRRIVSIN